MRLRSEVRRIRTTARFRAIRRALARGRDRFGFRLVHFSVQFGHLHLIAEAENRRCLARGMQGLAIRVARAVNRVFDRRGKVFADRYHLHVLRGPRETRNALAYVLTNHRKHAFFRGESLVSGATDGYSSARYFDGWKEGRVAPLVPAARGSPLGEDEHPVVAPDCWLLCKGWRRYGLVGVDEIPGAAGAV